MPRRFVVEIEIERESTIETVENLSSCLHQCFIPYNSSPHSWEPNFRYRIREAGDWSAWTEIR